jgi:nicotinate-nucleotide adenylyltransferase
VWFLVSYAPPHKQGQAITRFEQRCEMVTLATTGQPAFRVEPIEKELPPPSYTARTLAELHARHPEHTFALIVGGDSVHDLPTWFEPATVLRLARLVAVPRPGAVLPTAGELAAKVGVPAEQVRLTAVECPQVDIASRDTRQRVNAGKSVRFLVPRAVEEYVRERKLYRG